MTKIRITKPIDVYPELMPTPGKVYRAQRCSEDKCAVFFIIPDIAGKKIVVRENECAEVK